MGEKTQHIAPSDIGFAVLVKDSSLSHVETDQGIIAADWTLFVDTVHPELLHEPDRVVIAMSRAGELVGGWLERDPDAEDEGWIIVGARRRHAVAPGGLLGVVVLEALPYAGDTWHRGQPNAAG